MNTQQTNIKETNVLIAEFLELDKISSNVLKKALLSDLDYHLSFDSLMPAVEKIESLEDENGRIAYVTIHDKYCEILLKDSVIECDGETKLQAVYNAVISFIEWYNAENKPKNKTLEMMCDRQSNFEPKVYNSWFR